MAGKMMKSGNKLTKKIDDFADSVSAKERAVGGKLLFKGLTNFVTDIRHCPTREKEQERVNKELANIRRTFARARKKPLDGYQRKKYICKLVYMFTLGYEMDSVNFVYMEAVKMLSSDDFSEKLVGYLGVSVLLNEEHEVIPMVIQSMQNDMDSRIPLVRGLPLVAVANIGSLEMADTLSPTIMRIAIAADSSPSIRRRAVLSFLALYRKYPHLQTPDAWADKLETMLKEEDLGTVNAALTLVLHMAKTDGREEYRQLVPSVVGILHRIKVKQEFPKEYLYCDMAHPWLQCKCLRFLSMYPLPVEKQVQTLFFTVMETVADNSRKTRHVSDVNMRNVRNAVLFEMVHTMTTCVSGDEELSRLPQVEKVFQEIFLILGDYMVAETTEPNVFYLTLDALALFCSKLPQKKEMAKPHLSTVIKILSKRDITIRRRALDVLYGLCDLDNSKSVIEAMMQYLSSADAEFREELVLKIAILAEKFTEDYSWYFDVILRLVTEAGGSVPDDIWHRVVRIVTNNPDVHYHAASQAWRALQFPLWNETTIKLAGYILGEFGHLIADDSGSGPEAQLACLQSKFGYCTNSTRGLLLNTFGKFASEYPEELGARLSDLLQEYRSSYDCETQQRANEYFNLNEYEDADLITLVMAEMPRYEDTETPNVDSANTTSRAPMTPSKSVRRQASEQAAGAEDMRKPRERPGNVSGSDSDSDSDFDDHDAAPRGQELAPAGELPTFEQPTIIQTSSSVLQDWDRSGKHFRLLCLRADGVLYEGDHLQVGIKSQFSKAAGRYMVYYGNRSPEVIQALSASIASSSALAVQLNPLKDTLGGGEQAQQLINFVCLQEYALPPELKLEYSIEGKKYVVRTRLPLAITKFVSPKTMSVAEYLHAWKSMGASPAKTEYSVVFRMLSGKKFDLEETKKLLQDGLHFAVIPAVDPAPTNIVCAGVSWTQTTSESTDVFFRLQTNEELEMFKLSVRSFSSELTLGAAASVISALGDIQSVQEENVQLR